MVGPVLGGGAAAPALLSDLEARLARVEGYHGMTNFTDDDIRALVDEQRVHRSVYLDADLFELEMERIFGHTWVFVGHDSQVAKPGDYLCTRIGLQPMILVRHGDGAVRVLYNRCGHRGAQVVTEESGHATHFRCGYHGWTYETDGTLFAAPMPELYPDDFALDDRRFGMAELPRVASYRGFVFASLCPEGPDLAAHLGNAGVAIDEFVDRAPESEVEFIGGVQRYEFRANWKIQIENLADQYHTVFTHESSSLPDGQQFERRPGEQGSRTRLFTEDGKPVLHDAGTWVFEHGHVSAGAMHIDGEQTGEVFERYRALLVAKHGEEKTKDILKLKRHSGFFYPSLDLHMMGQFIRVIRPLAVDRTEVLAYPVHLKGAPIELFHQVIRIMNLSHSPPAIAQTDDMEMFERCQRGLAAQGNDWVWFARGLGQDVMDEVAGAMYGPKTSEIAQRHEYAAWLNYMTPAA